MNTLRVTTVAILAWLLAGCSSMTTQPADVGPRFDLFDYFEGNTRAWGIFQDRNGELKRQFTVDIRGEIEGNLLTLTEDFDYTDGEQSQRIGRSRTSGAVVTAAARMT